jgi:hypothetical protein
MKLISIIGATASNPFSTAIDLVSMRVELDAIQSTA